MKEKLTFKDGCMGSGFPWYIEYDVGVVTNPDDPSVRIHPCKHCHSDHIEVIQRSEFGDSYRERKWICPRVVVSLNEGGHNRTAICLDCILDATAFNMMKGKYAIY